jgi:predicted transglutaminase-like cysteine proteinase
MYGSFTKQMQDFGVSLQEVMVKHMQNTMKKQLELFGSMQAPVVSQTQGISLGMQKIMLEQMRAFTSSMQTPMDEQIKEFTHSVQRIMADQMQIFSASTHNPTEEQMWKFLTNIENTVNEQIKFAADMQRIMAEQMRQFTDNLQGAMSEITGHRAKQTQSGRSHEHE